MESSVLLKSDERSVFASIAAAPQPPGTIVRDFEALLDVIGADGVRVSPKTSEFSIAALPELNARLAEPGNIGLARGRQMSYPHLDGLHLLLRTSRIVRIDRVRAPPRMIIDRAMLERWQMLNPTERYFTLLEVWWNFADEEPQRRLFHASTVAGYRKDLVQSLRDKSKGHHSDPRRNEALHRLLGMTQIALMQMFGMLDVGQAVSVAGEGWKIQRMAATPWGLAACASYARAFSWTAEGMLASMLDPHGKSVLREPLNEISNDEDTPRMPPFLRWAKAVIPHFPEWRNVLGEPQEEAPVTGSITFKVTLGNQVWRRIAMPARCSFAELAMIILDAFDFDHSHLYQFTFADEYGVRHTLDDHRHDEAIDEFADAMTVGQAQLVPKQKIDFRYDFGDEWRFAVAVESVDGDTSLRNPKVVAKQGKAPKQYQWD